MTIQTLKRKIVSAGQLHLAQRQDGKFTVIHWIESLRYDRTTFDDYGKALSHFYNWKD